MGKRKIRLILTVATVMTLLMVPELFAKGQEKENTNFLNGKPFQYLLKEIDEIDLRVSAVEKKATEFQTLITTLVEEVFTLQGQIPPLQQELGTMQHDLEKNYALIKNLESNLLTLQQEIDKKVSSLTGAIEEGVSTLQGQISPIQQELGTMQNDLDKNYALIKGLESRLMTLQQKIDTKISSLIEAIENAENEQRGQIALLLEQNKTYHKMIVENQGSITSLQHNLQIFIQQLDDLQGTVSANQTEINNLQNVCIMSQSGIATLQIEINQLNEAIVLNQNKMNQLWQAIDSGGNQVLTATPNTNVQIKGTKDRLWLFTGSVNYQSFQPHFLNAQLVVDGTLAGVWSEGRIDLTVLSTAHFSFTKVYLIPAGEHVVKFKYDLSPNYINETPIILSHQFTGIALK